MRLVDERRTSAVTFRFSPTAGLEFGTKRRFGARDRHLRRFAACDVDRVLVGSSDELAPHPFFLQKFELPLDIDLDEEIAGHGQPNRPELAVWRCGTNRGRAESAGAASTRSLVSNEWGAGFCD